MCLTQSYVFKLIQTIRNIYIFLSLQDTILRNEVIINCYYFGGSALKNNTTKIPYCYEGKQVVYITILYESQQGVPVRFSNID